MVTTPNRHIVYIFMKLRRTPILWFIFFAISLYILNEVAQAYVEPRELNISYAQAQEIGQKIWQNEGAGKFDNLVVWNKHEDFPSLGIGHFIWFPQDVKPAFEESFPSLIHYIGETKKIPEWLINSRYPPWPTRADFISEKANVKANQLRHFLDETMPEQTQFMVLRLEKALPKILKHIKNSFVRMHVRENFYHVAMEKNGIYALVDYVNFKGEGVSSSERYRQQGWGLLQVLEHMDNSPKNVMQAFVDSANRMLRRRVLNAPRDESHWLPGWNKRLETYLDPAE